jgi:hypothetical protein
MELDCAGKRLRKLSSVSHLAGGGTINIPGATSPWDDARGGLRGTWRHYKLFREPQAPGAPRSKESIAAKMLATVCPWPEIKPTGNAVLEAPDFPALIDRISTVITKHKEQK